MTKNTANIIFSRLSELVLLSFFLLFSLNLNAQLPEDVFLEKNISVQELDKKKWEEITSDMDYSGKRVELKEEEGKKEDSFGDEFFRERNVSSGGSAFGAGLFKIFAIKFIRAAKEKGDYALAMRLYYLAIIKEMSLKKLIKWKRDKTNGEYLRELRSSNFFTEFNEVTNIFERIWYGGGKIDAGTFAGFEGKFRGLVERIKK